MLKCLQQTVKLLPFSTCHNKLVYLGESRVGLKKAVQISSNTANYYYSDSGCVSSPTQQSGKMSPKKSRKLVKEHLSVPVPPGSGGEEQPLDKPQLGKKKRRQAIKIELEQESGEVEVCAEKESPIKSLSPRKKVPKEETTVESPKNWKTILENIQAMRSTKTAAVDTMGCERTADLQQTPKVQRFQTLVSLMLSSQTKDQVTYAAMDRLKGRGLTVQSMLDIAESELAEILKPVSFYKRKAIYIKKTAETLRENYGDDIPRTVDDLCGLMGVGPKMAYICMNAAWNENAGIGVDTHVHRIANRLKWTGKKGTSTPEKTREALESWLPKDLWQEVNVLLVGFGQETCLPLRPKCEICLNKEICPSSTARGKSSKKKE